MNQKNHYFNMYHIKPFLRKRGYNLSSLASTMGMTFQRFDHHIKPKDDLSFNFITKLCEHLNISVEEFIESVKSTDHVAEN
jgi:DNA-binding Xre family transcriptional regulator